MNIVLLVFDGLSILNYQRVVYFHRKWFGYDLYLTNL
jgi:hypothetical protein